MKRTWLGIGTWFLAASAAAQAGGDAASARARLPAETRCVEQARADLDQWIRLLADARRQLDAPSASEAVRRDAVEAVTVLESRIRETAEELMACVPPPAEAAEAAPAEAPEAAALAAISVHLRAGTPTSVGGRLDAGAVHRALLPFGRGFDDCYEQFAERHAIVRGTATLRLTVHADGSVHAPRIESMTVGDATLARCATAAAVHVASPGRPTGGEAQVSVPLHLGPEG